MVEQHGLLEEAAWLRQRYVDEGLSARQVGALAGGVSEATVLRALRRHALGPRPQGTRVLPARSRQLLGDAAWLRDCRERGLTLQAIAALAGVTVPTLHAALQRHGLDLTPLVKQRAQHAQLQDAEWCRQRYELDRLSVKEIARLVGASPSTVLLALDRHQIPRRATGKRPQPYSRHPDLHDVEWLTAKFVHEGMTAQAIADLAGCHRSTVKTALRRAGITRS